MSANNSPLKGVVGSKWKNVGVVEDKKPEEPSQRRRSSSDARFSGLTFQKRNSGDADAAARKASFAEQNKAPGIIGGLWQRSDSIVVHIKTVITDANGQFHQRALEQQVGYD
ncbi:MAG: hypothetical protein Q9225_000117 [Loekoesia sp. 1 TL-2023]